METVKKVLLHVGCGGYYKEGFINSDKDTHSRHGREYKLDQVMELSKPWPYEDNSVDGIVGMGVFQQLYWIDLIVAFKEAYRVLKPGGALRIGTPLLGNGKPLSHILGWKNVNLFTYSLLERVLLHHIEFSTCKMCNLGYSSIPEFTKVDNRSEHMFYIEATK